MSDKALYEYKCTLCQDTLDCAKKDLNEDPETRYLELKAFSQRLQQYPGLKARLDPKFLIRFLRARKFDQERATALLVNYYKMRKEDPDIFTGLKPSSIRHVYDMKASYPHSKRDRLGRQIFIIRPSRTDFSRVNALDMFKSDFLSLSKMIEDEENQVRGFTLIVDYADFTMAQAVHVNLDFARKTIRMWQDAFPARLKCILLVNEPHFVDVVTKLFTTFMKDKLSRRMHRIGTNWEKLHEFIAPEDLPEKYGGTLQNCPDPEVWKEKMLASDLELEEDSKFGFVDYTIGHETSKHQQDAITQMAGTFKKLDV